MTRMVQQYEFGPLVPEGWRTSTQKVRDDMTPHLRGAVIRRDRGLCRYCTCKPEIIEIDHVKPVCRGGQSTMQNCVTACRPCIGLKLASDGGERPPLTPSGLLVTRAVETKEGWRGQIIVDKNIVFESEPQDEQSDALAAANDRVVTKLATIFGEDTK
jgi:hypothetical protein